MILVNASSVFVVCVGCCFLTLVTLQNNSNGAHLRCIFGLVCTSRSHDGTDIDWFLLIAVLATTGDKLELSVHLLWLVQEMLEKNTPNVLL